MKVQFYGAAQRVTGSKHLITTKKGTKILLDCGMFQGINTSELNLKFGFNPKEIDYLLLSHAHIDHSGLIPRLVKLGFTGQIFCTEATKSLCQIMLLDSARIQERDLERVNKRRKKRGEETLELLYEEEDVEKAMSLFQEIHLNKPFYLEEGIKVEYYNAGHILGSAGIMIDFEEDHHTKKLYFTGDIGRPNDKILSSPAEFPQADYIICESTYGNRLHEPEVDMKAHLLEIVHNTCVKKRGKLIIPAFAVDRTQELVYALDQLENEGKLPHIPVYVDSPLAVQATMVMKRHREDFNPEILKYIERDGDAFGFNNLHYITDVNDSKALNNYDKPCIIISASGMAEAGRIKHHIANNVENARNTILMVGYCSPNSLGQQLKSGEPIVKIFGEEKFVKAEIAIMDSFSAHADYTEMIGLLKCQDPQKVKKLFLVHGEIETQTEFKKKLEVEGFKNVVIPAQGEWIEL
ncbi:MAG: MBL fold metallo-hydrolase [Spirosomataceae bacterium]|jgi:metallo-beta-lactamase family protein